MRPSLLETIRFSEPLRDARIGGVTLTVLPPPPDPRLQQEREQAMYERGRQEGEAALSEQLLRQRAELLELQNGVLESLRQSIPQVIRDCEKTLIALSLETARRLVAGMPISAEVVEAAVHDATAQVEAGTEFSVYLHAEDLELLQRANSPMLLPGGAMDRVKFKASPEVTRGGCLVQTRFGVIDARRETKLDLLRKSIQA